MSCSRKQIRFMITSFNVIYPELKLINIIIIYTYVHKLYIFKPVKCDRYRFFCVFILEKLMLFYK